MDLLRIAARVAAETVALPEGWRMITDEQIEQVMALLPTGSQVYGSYATGKATAGSDLDVKLPEDVGEKALSRLMMKVMGEVDLPNGAVNLSMPCSEHENCSIVAHVSSVALLPPHIEHIQGGIKDPSELSEESAAMRNSRKEYFKELLETLESDAELRPSAMDKRALRKFLDGGTPEEILGEWKPLLDEETFKEWVSVLEKGIG